VLRKTIFLAPILLISLFSLGISLVMSADNFEFYDDFSSDSKMWNYLGGAYRNPINEYLVLTENIPSQTGIAWLKFQFKSSFSISFKFRAGGGTGGDGFVFMFYKQYYNLTDPWSRHLSGMQLGYGIEFDSYDNDVFPIGGIDPSENHIALIKDGYTNHLISVDDIRTDDNSWHYVNITVNPSSVVVIVDSDRVFESVGSLDRGFSQVGFAASTGDEANSHIIDDVLISIGPEPVINMILGMEERIEVGTLQTIGFHAKWNTNNSDVIGGIIHINGTRYVTNGTGWITFQDTSLISKKRSWTITDVDCGGVNTFLQIISNPLVIWDKIETEYSIDTYTPGVVEVVLSLSFVYDGLFVENALVEVNQKPARNIGDGQYQAILSGVWVPYETITILGRMEDFEDIELKALIYPLGNIILMIATILIIVYVLLMRDSK